MELPYPTPPLPDVKSSLSHIYNSRQRASSSEPLALLSCLFNMVGTQSGAITSGNRSVDGALIFYPHKSPTLYTAAKEHVPTEQHLGVAPGGGGVSILCNPTNAMARLSAPFNTAEITAEKSF